MDKIKIDELKVQYQTYKNSEHYLEREQQSEFAILAREIIKQTLKNDLLKNENLTGFIQMFSPKFSKDNFRKYLVQNISDPNLVKAFIKRYDELKYHGYTGVGKSAITGLNKEQLENIKNLLNYAFQVSNLDEALQIVKQYDELNIPQVKSGIYSPWLHYINPLLFPIMNNGVSDILNYFGIKTNYPDFLININELSEILGESNLGHIDFMFFWMNLPNNKSKGSNDIISQGSNMSIESLIDSYKSYINSESYNELYKWSVIKNFQEKWDIEIKDFATMLNNSLQPVSCNLWTAFNYLPRKMITSIALKNPDEVRRMFSTLFDENQDLSERITIFQNKAQELVNLLNPVKKLSSYQDKRAICVYLALMFPEKYYLFKHDMYVKFCDITGLRDKPKKSKKGNNDIIFDYFDLCNEVRDELIKDTDLIRKHISRLNFEKHYQENNFNVLTQDFIYYVANKFSKDITEPEEEGLLIPNNDDKKYWLISIRDYENNWEKWQKEGIAAIEFDKLGDLKKYSSRDEMQIKLKELYPGETEKTHSSLACYEFANIVKPDDILIVKEGTGEYIGYGKVISDYYFDGEEETKFKNKIRVEWLKLGQWFESDGKIVSKVFTDITKYPDYVKKLMKVINNNVSNIDSSNNTNLSYWWLNANPKIWKIDEFEIGQEQSYTSHNDKGNKRRIYEYFNQVKPGDLIIGYESTPNKKVKAVFEVTEGLHIDDDTNEEQITFKIKEFVPYQASWEELSSVKELYYSEVMNNNQGSLFKLTKEEYNIIINRCNTTGEAKKEKYSKKDILNEVFIGEDKLDNIINLLKHKKNLIFQGPPGTGKTYIAKRVAYTMLGRKDTSFVETIQFHQSYSYEDFIQGLRPSDYGGFYLKNGIFYELALRAQRDPKNDYFLIIDEINRGNLSKIFGELMMLIENDKRGNDFQINLTYSPNTKFYVPENLYIIGTMNTADRSLAMVDYALRRRFSFIDMEPVFNDRFRNHLKALNVPVNKIDWLLNGLNDINELIEKDSNLGRDYRIGHSYFCSIDEENIEDHLRNIINYEIKPLLEEYWFDNKTKVDDCLKRFK